MNMSCMCSFMFTMYTYAYLYLCINTERTLVDTCFETNCMFRSRRQRVKHANKEINWCEIDVQYYDLVLLFMAFKFGV